MIRIFKGLSWMIGYLVVVLLGVLGLPILSLIAFREGWRKDEWVLEELNSR